jgi:hypothetical protein
MRFTCPLDRRLEESYDNPYLEPYGNLQKAQCQPIEFSIKVEGYKSRVPR